MSPSANDIASSPFARQSSPAANDNLSSPCADDRLPRYPSKSCCGSAERSVLIGGDGPLSALAVHEFLKKMDHNTEYVHCIIQPGKNYGFAHFTSFRGSSAFYWLHHEIGLDSPLGRLRVNAAKYTRTGSYVHYLRPMEDKDKARANAADDRTPIYVEEKEKAPQAPQAPQTPRTPQAPQTPQAPHTPQAQAPSMEDNDRKRKRLDDSRNVMFLIQQRRRQFDELLSESLESVKADIATAPAELTRVSAALTKLIQTVVKVAELEDLGM
ncbi:hypothetical protein DFS34DRAFT_6667 [Phlyctochytrium arcticum]|nr:hypothetical protein DFS34DRAFT_6667 [Phlyctochytrium arcticum]